MKFKIIEHNSCENYRCGISYKRLHCDENVASLLGLTLMEYQLILIKHGAYESHIDQEYYFKSKEDAQKCVDYLEPYAVMAEIVE